MRKRVLARMRMLELDRYALPLALNVGTIKAKKKTLTGHAGLRRRRRKP